MCRSCDLYGYVCVGHVIFIDTVYRSCNLYGYMYVGHVIFMDTCM